MQQWSGCEGKVVRCGVQSTAVREHSWSVSLCSAHAHITCCTGTHIQYLTLCFFAVLRIPDSASNKLGCLFKQRPKLNFPLALLILTTESLNLRNELNEKGPEKTRG